MSKIYDVCTEHGKEKVSRACCYTSLQDAKANGFHVTLVSDATATVTPELQNATITTMKDRYARVLNTQEALQELLEYVRGVTL